jgi:hypothetical protein
MMDSAAAKFRRLSGIPDVAVRPQREPLQAVVTIRRKENPLARPLEVLTDVAARVQLAQCLSQGGSAKVCDSCS